MPPEHQTPGSLNRSNSPSTAFREQPRRPPSSIRSRLQVEILKVRPILSVPFTSLGRDRSLRFHL
ncbi:hypothetical protein MA16_Dca022197 [Dendrobium catenatum]|uniref:Uncharacterized protein n=1 Tax=Dendrobium catenatum TaxID=906689 RepID=A0A2I0VID8_9ASPA|nr:hypothetical protein MA16_Dca022197 [Dendrobium catenatum]